MVAGSRLEMVARLGAGEVAGSTEARVVGGSTGSGLKVVAGSTEAGVVTESATGSGVEVVTGSLTGMVAGSEFSELIESGSDMAAESEFSVVSISPSESARVARAESRLALRTGGARVRWGCRESGGRTLEAGWEGSGIGGRKDRLEEMPGKRLCLLSGVREVPGVWGWNGNLSGGWMS